MERIGSVGGAGYVPDGDGLDVSAGCAVAGGDELALELETDRADLDGLEPASRTEASHGETAAAGLVRALLDGGWTGVDAFLDTRPEEVREMVSLPEGELRAELSAAFASISSGGAVGALRSWWFGPSDLMSRLEERFEPMIHERIRSAATSTIRAQLGALESTTPEALLATLRSAAPGSAAASLAAEIGVRGDDLDLDRVELHLRTAREELEMLRDVLEGGTWTPDELPGTSTRLMDELGLDDVAEDSIAASAFRRSEWSELPAELEMSADLAHAAFEVTEAFTEASAAGHGLAAGAAGAAVPAGVAIGAIAFGIALHHAIEENRMERREAARHLGL